MSEATIHLHPAGRLLALVGNPNCGKTALFNRLTGSHQKVGNYAGVTVERKEGRFSTPEGKNIRKAFLRSPLEFSRITSGFSSARFHPVLQKWRAHKGVDYGAPTGTRVKATGDAVVAPAKAAPVPSDPPVTSAHGP